MLAEREHSHIERQPTYAAKGIESDIKFAEKLRGYGVAEEEIYGYLQRRQALLEANQISQDHSIAQENRTHTVASPLPITLGDIPILYQWQREDTKRSVVTSSEPVTDTHIHPTEEKNTPDLSNTHHHHHPHRKKEKPKNLMGHVVSKLLLINAFMPWGCPGDDLWPIGLNVANSVFHIAPVNEKQESSEKDMVLPSGIQIVVEVEKENKKGEGKSALDVLRERKKAREEAEEKEAQLLANIPTPLEQERKKKAKGFAKLASVVGIGLALFGAGDATAQNIHQETAHISNKISTTVQTPEKKNTTGIEKKDIQKPRYSFEEQYIVRLTDTSYDQILMNKLRQENPELNGMQLQPLVNALRNYEEIEQHTDFNMIDIGQHIMIPGKTTIDIIKKALKRFPTVQNSTNANYLVRVSKAANALANPQEADTVENGVIYDVTTQNAAATIREYMQFIQINEITV
ncbi:MAG TPA: hypothetical protein VLF89_08470 [Candidatus Saccharimonadales bacterium]|nr:hypothetical protein [Candidatus Saccharimonadales bacterium]